MGLFTRKKNDFDTKDEKTLDLTDFFTAPPRAENSEDDVLGRIVNQKKEDQKHTDEESVNPGKKEQPDPNVPQND